MCEISRSVKTNRGSSCGGGEGWEMYIFFNVQTLTNGGRGGGGGQEDGKREDPDPANVHIPAITVKD